MTLQNFLTQAAGDARYLQVGAGDSLYQRDLDIVSVGGDVATLAEATDALVETGGIVLIPPGDFTFDDDLAPASSILYWGSGARQYSANTRGTRLIYTGAGTAFDLTSAQWNAFRDLRLDLTGAGAVGFHFGDPCSQISLDSVVIKGSGVGDGQVGVLFTGQVNCSCHNEFNKVHFNNLAVCERLSGFANANLHLCCLYAASGIGVDLSAVAPNTVAGSENEWHRCEFSGVALNPAINVDDGAIGNGFYHCVTDGVTADLVIAASAVQTRFVACRFAATVITDASPSTSMWDCWRGAQKAGVGRTSAIDVNQGTITSPTPALNVAVNWNDAADTFKALVASVTDTNSATGSKLIDLLTDGVSQFSVDKDGNGIVLGDLDVGGTLSAGALVQTGALGVLGIDRDIVGTAGITAETDTNLSVAVNVAADRRIQITCCAMISCSTAEELAILRIKEGATVLQVGQIHLDEAGGPGQSTIQFSVIVDDPAAGAHTYKVSLEAEGTGPVFMVASATNPARIDVQDIGAMP